MNTVRLAIALKHEYTLPLEKWYKYELLFTGETLIKNLLPNLQSQTLTPIKLISSDKVSLVKGIT